MRFGALLLLLMLFPLLLFAQDTLGATRGLPPWYGGDVSEVPQVLVCTTKWYARPDTTMQCFQTGASYPSTMSVIASYFRLIQIVRDKNRIYYYFEKK